MWMDLGRKTLALTFAGVMLLGLAGCNTMEGAGEDVERAGEETQEAAE